MPYYRVEFPKSHTVRLGSGYNTPSIPTAYYWAGLMGHLCFLPLRACDQCYTVTINYHKITRFISKRNKPLEKVILKQQKPTFTESHLILHFTTNCVRWDSLLSCGEQTNPNLHSFGKTRSSEIQAGLSFHTTESLSHRLS